MPELNNGEGADDSIRSTLAAALAEHEKTETDATSKPNGAAAEAAGEGGADGGETGESTTGERKRGPDGKFVKAEGIAGEESGEAEIAADAGKDAGKEAAADKPDPQQQQQAAFELGSNWSPKDRTDFAKLAPEGQRILKDMITRQEADYQKKTEKVGELRREYEPIDQMFAPHREVMKQKGLTPSGIIRAWANVEEALVNGRGVDVVRGLIDSYKIDKNALARSLGLTAGGQEQQQDQQLRLDAQGNPIEPLQLPPEVAAEIKQLRERQDAWERKSTDVERQTHQARLDAKEAEITNFKTAQDAKGQLLHPHFAEVEEDMNSLALGHLARKQPVPPLQQLYETAVWANASTREKQRTAETQAAELKRKEDEKAKAAAARKAASSVTGAPGSGQSTGIKPAERSLREELLAAADDQAAA